MPMNISARQGASNRISGIKVSLAKIKWKEHLILFIFSDFDITNFSDFTAPTIQAASAKPAGPQAAELA